ncbi:MAG: 4Fe-4S binding protein [Phycisphaerales bacterium]|nr:4Fe-4S binding protein [Phycisphaerales bacterium]
MSQTNEIPLKVTKKKKLSRTRWIVLILVQVLILFHIGLWLLSKHYGWFDGEAITPIEPSEGMELVKNGVINAGAIFFVLALLSTWIFGRWFCGWGCHIVFLQDWCYALLRKIGIRPKPFRARLLGWVPLGLGLYMFVWPLFYRIVIAPWFQPNLSWPSITTRLTTTEYWDSFVSPIMGVPFLFVCGFATVYTLGAKGFCTYGCPYGGFFAPLDRVSPMHIRVNNNCQQCGECTAACTSSVRVHEEVHIHKMVVDSGCMKTMSCIDACPNDALSVGFVGVAVGKKSGASTHKYDMTFWGEVWIMAIFLIGFFSFRGLYASIPMLMSVGMSLVGTWIIWKGVAILREKNVNWHRWQLKFHGSLRPAGLIVMLISLSVVLFTIQSAAVGLLAVVGNAAAKRGDLNTALSYYKLSGPITDGGIGFASNPNVDLSMSKIQEAKGDLQEAERLLRRLNSFVGNDQTATMVLGQNLQLHRDPSLVEQFYIEHLTSNPDWTLVWEDYIAWLRREGRSKQAIEASKNANTMNPNATRLQLQWQLLHQ